MKNLLHIGIDIGSTTVKIAVLDELKHCLHACYVRHYTDIRQKVWDLLENAYEIFGDRQITMAITGSGGIALADYLGITFIQEVIAGTKAVRTYHPQSDVIIELGGEDAKITYLTGGNEHRMNGNCAGGTGAFIDQMATLLHTDASGLNALAEKSDTLYPIAARCGVFAKTDVQALLNDGASKENVAASVFQSIVLQTITGLACGRPIRGTVCFLGGPLTFLPQLRKQFARTLHLRDDQVVAPENAQVYVAIGAALGSFKEKPLSFMHLMRQLKNVDESSLAQSDRVEPLFASKEEFDEFNRRHSEHTVPRADLSSYRGPCYLGLDAGSTTIKAVLLSEDNKILYSHYQNNEGSPLKAAQKIVAEIYRLLPEGAFIAKSGITGYGEFLLKEALHIDLGEVETIAHYQAAAHFCPDVDFILDIGGQDMKCSRLKDGHIEDILLNEACSSGCGSFLDTFAKSLNLSIEEFAKAALFAKSPIDLGSRCTVFMNSKVKQAQKEGATLADISAGLSYSVIKNALYKVIKLRDSGELGDTVVVQGGTFLNDAVLRAFELLTEREVTRPNIAGLMGAFGAALTARMHYEDIADDDNAHVGADGRSVDAAAAEESAAGDEPNAAAHAGEIVVDGVRHTVSSILTGEALNEMSMTTERDVCKLCQNHCKLTITTFSDGSRFVTGNRCERGGDAKKKRSDRPNLYDYKYKRCFAYRRLTDKNATRGEIGIPRALNMYENYPFWFTLLTSLGFKVMISGRSSHELFETGIESIASENICYPAKLVHGHIKWLLNKGMKTIFYPCVSYEDNLVPNTDNHYNCPVVANYPLVVGANMPELRDPDVRYMHPYFNLANHELMVDRIVEEFAWASVSREEAETAVKAAYAEDKVFKHDVQQEGLKALAYMKEHDCRGIVLAGRPYHIDPEINHGIPETICALGMVVLSEDSICELQPGEKLDLTDFLSEGEEDPRKKNANGFRHVDDRKVTVNRMPLRVTNQWAYHSRLYAAAHFVASYPGLELVQLNSFGCGLDAITTDQVAEILADKADVYTLLKIDEVSNLGAAKIRLRSLKAAVEEREANKARMAKAALATSDESGSAESDAPRNAAHAAAQAAARKAQEQAESDLATAQAALAEAQAAVAAAEAKVKAADRPVDAADAGSDAAAPANAPKSTGFRKTGSKAPTPGRQVLLDATMAANPKLTKAMRDASKRAAKRDIADVRLAALGDGTTNDAANAKSKSAKSKSGHNNATMSRYAHREKFVKDMKKDYTIVAPQMSPIHFSLVESVIRSGGYKFDILKHASREDVETGLKYVNNDACYPAIMVIGQLIDAILEGKYDPDKVCLAITQTGGMCRATNYFGLIRKALIDAGYPQIPVIAISTQGLEDNPGFKVTPALLHRTVKALILGDLLMKCLYRVRPYELEKGSANALHRKWRDICIDSLTSEHPKYRYAQLCRGIVEDFDALPIDETLKKPRVGVVGEILVKYMPLANNHVVDLLEREGAEAVVPDLLDFFAATIYEQDFKHTHLGKGWTASASAKFGIPALQRMRRPAIEALKASKRFDPPMAINHVAELAKPFLSIGNQYGEGWFLAGEMAELITSGTPNIVCIQPFACLPNHVVGKGVIKALRAAYPGANIVAVDYDPGASEVNQLNRIKLMLTAAQRALHAQEATPKKPQPPEAPSISLPHPKVAML